MNEFRRVVDSVVGVAEVALPDVLVVKGSLDQISQQMIDAETPVIGLDTTFTMTQEESRASVKTATITMIFGLSDNPDNTEEHTANIIYSMDILSDQFLDSYEEVFTTHKVELSNIRRTPFYKRMASTYSGLILDIDVVIGNCGKNTFPSLSRYTELIDSQIDPYTWIGIDERDS